MNTSTLPKKQLSISLNRDFYEELSPRPYKMAKTFKKHSDQYQLLLTDSQTTSQNEEKAAQNSKLNNFITSIFDFILGLKNWPIIRDFLEIFQFLATPRK